MIVEVEYASAGCNCIYNCLELASDFILYGANNSLAIYDVHEEKVINTLVVHRGQINCVRFVKNTLDNHRWVITSAYDGAIALWRAMDDYGNENLSNFLFEPKILRCISQNSVNICEAIQVNSTQILIGTVNSVGQVLIYLLDLEADNLELFQDIDIQKSVALDFVFYRFGESENNIIFALGMDTGSVILYGRDNDSTKNNLFSPVCTLNKHEDWVRCITFVSLENGDVLMASGGEDSFIAIWRFTKNKPEIEDFEFQIHHYQDYIIVFDSMIMGHEGWINSLDWSTKGELLSCSSDQSTIIWENQGEIWMEKSRFGVMGGQLPGGFGAKFDDKIVVSWGFQGAIQIWSKSDENEAWNIQPSITGHFSSVADLDYHPKGYYIISTSDDQTTRVHAPWGPNRWHEIARPQIHGHDLYAVKSIGNLIVSGAEEKILRAFQPTEIFVQNLDIISDINADFKEVSASAFLPVLGLSNQSASVPDSAALDDVSVEVRLDEDFIRSQTLWAEVSKLYGHVYEISCIATSPVDKLIASGSQANKPQFAAIILWCAEKWKNLGDFPFHKLNVTDMEFSPDGGKLLSVSRDRVWAVWNVCRPSGENEKFSLQLIDSGNFHSRALWVGTWAPLGNFFVTGARDRKLAIWKSNNETQKYEMDVVESFVTSVSAVSVNPDGIIAVGLESGEIFFYQYNEDSANKEEKFKLLEKLDNSIAHHDVVKRLKFNPAEKLQLASAGADHIVKVYQLTPPP